MATVVVIGQGGREHAIVECLRRSPSQPKVIALPGNPGMLLEEHQDLSNISIKDLDSVYEAVIDIAPELVVVGPEVPLVQGLGDRLRASGIAVFGPNQQVAQLEGSKAFAKSLMQELNIPTAKWKTCTDAEEAKRFARQLGVPVVIKADGLAAGKGVVIALDLDEADSAIDNMLQGQFGAASREIVVEEFLEGEEVSVHVVCDGTNMVVFPASQDHKRALDGDLGLNTGGMGAYSPAPIGTTEVMQQAVDQCVAPIVKYFKDKGSPYIGVIYVGLMVTQSGVKVLEYNVRFGDPETQVILPIVTEDLYLLFLQAAKGQLPSSRYAEVKDGSGIVIVMASYGYPQSSRSGDIISGIAEANALSDVQVYQAGTTVNEQGQIVTSGGRVLGVTASGSSLKEAADKAYQACQMIEFDGAWYRRDIGHRAMNRNGDK